jgi:hypothetical protein
VSEIVLLPVLLAALVLLALAAVTVGALRTLPRWVRDMWRSDRLDIDGRLELRRRTGTPTWRTR